MENNQKRILIVEDDVDLRISLTDKLESFNYKVFQAGDGEVAVTLFVDEKPDLVVLDLLVPKLDGFKVLERIRNYPDDKISQTKVVVLSNLWSDKDILRAQALKVDEYFVKANTDLEEVYGKIKVIMSSHV